MAEANQNTGYVSSDEDRSSGWAQAREWLLPSKRLRRRVWPLAIGLAYVAVIDALGGLRSDHVILGLLPLLDSYNERSRKFLGYFLPFLLTGAVYDSMRYFYWQGIAGHIYVAEPYYRDLHHFAFPSWISGSAQPQTFNEFFAAHSSVPLDLLCGLAYLTFVGEYLVTAFYLFFRERWQTLRLFGWSFFMVNVLGFITYFIYPAAPPWYVTRYGLGPARMDVRPDAAAALRFDRILGTHFFDQVYGRGVDVYGAYPSLHVTYPLLAMLVVFGQRELRWLRVPAVAFYALMCLSAMYLQHHYVVDILMGTGYALLTWFALRIWFVRHGAGEASGRRQVGEARGMS